MLPKDIALALRLLARNYRGGELTLLAAALVIAVASVTTVGFFTDRVHRALDRQANQLLGADLVVAADHPLPPALEAQARQLGLSAVRMMSFPSMAAKGDTNVLASVKVVTPGYPLRGTLRVADRLYGPDRVPPSVPAPGSVWADEKLYTQLGLAIGDAVTLGSASLTVSAILTQEPDAAIGFINAGPRIIVNSADIAATGLVQTGSRIRYRLQIAGEPGAVDAYRAWSLSRLAPGERVEGIRDARPEIRSALERAEKFLGLATLVSVLLAAAAIALAARRFLQRHLDGCAMMRCLGASQGTVVRVYFIQFLLLGLAASAAGCAAGLLAQLLLAKALMQLLAIALPAPGMEPALYGVATGLALLIGFALPPLTGLARVPPLRVIRRDLGAPDRAGIAGYALGFALIAAMIFWHANDWTLGAWVLGGFAGAAVACGLIAWLLLRLTSGLREGGISWRFGIANLRRRPLGSVIQVVSLGLGMMALLTLTLVRNDLLETWQTSLPPQAPNRFIVNIQPEQLQPLGLFFARRGVTMPATHPMVRGRLTRINARGVSSADYADDRARRLVDREFNLSSATRMQSDNRIVAGRWWGAAPDRKDQFSVEDGIARTLGIRIGDRLTFDIAGTPTSGVVTSLRKVDWDTFNVNFFVVAPPGLLDGAPVSHITSFYLPPGNAELLSELVKQFPNLLLIDVAQVLAQVQAMMGQVALAVQFIFLFTLLAGLVVLYAAIASTQDERLYQATLMRTLGANRRQLRRAVVAEFAVVGALAGLLAAAGASAVGYAIAWKVLHLDFTFSPAVWLIGVGCGALGVAAAGYLGTRRVLSVPPLAVLRQGG
jgi:putative ABC transport system permease protein